MNELEQRVLEARTDEQKLNELVESHKQWILRVASETTKRYVTDSDDAWSAALSGFVEAVQGFEEEKGSFRAFAAVVIRRRVQDWLRSEARHSADTAVNPAAFGGDLPEEEAAGVNLQVQERVAAEAVQAETDDIGARARDEIAEMQAILANYAFSFFDLVECSPKAEKTKRECAAAVQTLLENEEWIDRMRRTRTLPMRELSSASHVSRKILDRHRRYLIAAVEILTGDFPILSGYLRFIRKV